jgi:trigger factor
MIIRDKVIDDADLEVTDDDLRDFFSDQMQGQEDISVEQIRGFYQSMPRMMEQVDQQVLSRKVYDELIDRFDVRELDLETFRQEIQAEHAAAHGHEHHDHDHDHDHDHGPAEEDDAPSSIIT